METNDLNKIKNRDFFTATKDNFEINKNIKSRLVYGRYLNPTPFVTILISTYNRGELLWAAVESALNQQGFNDFQIIISDDYPQSDENNVIKKLKEYNDERIIYFKNEQNMGQYGNRNRLIELAKSEWITTLDDDDMFCEYHLKMLSEIIKQNKKIDHLGTSKFILYGNQNNTIEIKEKYNNDSKYSKFNIFSYNFGYDTQLAGGFTRREYLIQLGGYDVNESMMEDYVMSIRLAHSYNTYKCLTPSYIYRITDNNTSNGNIWQKQFTYEYFLFRAISKKHFKLFQPFLLYKAKYIIQKKAEKMLDKNSNYLRKKVNLNLEELQQDCNLPKKRFLLIDAINIFICKGITLLNNIIIKIKDFK